MKLLSVRFLDAVQWSGKSIVHTNNIDHPELHVSDGYVWLYGDAQRGGLATPLANVQQIATAPPEQPKPEPKKKR